MVAAGLQPPASNQFAVLQSDHRRKREKFQRGDTCRVDAYARSSLCISLKAFLTASDGIWREDFFSCDGVAAIKGGVVRHEKSDDVVCRLGFNGGGRGGERDGEGGHGAAALPLEWSR